MEKIGFSIVIAAALTALGMGMSFWGFVANGGDPNAIHHVFRSVDFWLMNSIIFVPIFVLTLGVLLIQTNDS